MNRVERALLRVVADLSTVRVPWAVVGGFAVSVWAEPRLTRDVDVAVAVESDADAEGVIRAMNLLGWRALELVEQEAALRLATARLSCSEPEIEGVLLDVLFASSGIEREVVSCSVPVEILPGCTVPVTTRGHLIAMKLLARDDRARPQDADDLRVLLRAASDDDLAEARRAVRLITDRGFSRNRDLEASLDAEVRDAGR